ncbi:putative cytochrome P450 6a13, partial [Temnothorax longispinosus]
MIFRNHRAIGMYSLHKPNLVIVNPDLIRIVLTKEFESFHDRGVYCNEKIDPLTGNLFFMSGKKWRNMRVKMTPTFTSGKIKQMFPIVKKCSEILAKYLESKAQMRDSVQMKDMFASYIFFIAGFETSAATTTFAVYELAQHQDIQDKVRKEIDEILTKHGGLIYDAVNEMTYLHKTIRKYPSLPVLNRICTKDIDLPTTNIHLPKGTLITIPVRGLAIYKRKSD